jgi:hypothetical protein
MSQKPSHDYQDVLLEAEVAPSQRTRFEKEYERRTGQTPRIGRYYQIQRNKFGAELRVYFNVSEKTAATLEKEFNVERRSGGYRGDREFRINTQKFFWRMVSLGYRLGTN